MCAVCVCECVCVKKNHRKLIAYLHKRVHHQHPRHCGAVRLITFLLCKEFDDGTTTFKLEYIAGASAKLKDIQEAYDQYRVHKLKADKQTVTRRDWVPQLKRRRLSCPRVRTSRRNTSGRSGSA